LLSYSEQFIKTFFFQAKHNIIEDETPWAQLASLALFKLFNDWQNQGFQIPSELLRAPDVAVPPVITPEVRFENPIYLT
jgi:hypothetical protein